MATGRVHRRAADQTPFPENGPCAGLRCPRRDAALARQARSTPSAVGPDARCPGHPPRRARSVTWLNHRQAVPITIGMTLFPSALRSDRPGHGRPAPLVPGLRNLVMRILFPPASRSRPRSFRSVTSTRQRDSHHARPEPRLQLDRSARAPDGDFAASAVPNAELGITDIPRRGESWDTVSDFALSYDGYGTGTTFPSWRAASCSAGPAAAPLPATLDELRGCLFYEQRRWHHFGEEPTGRSAEYMWALVDAIAALADPLTSRLRRRRVAPDPRPGKAREAHVRLLSNRAVVDATRSPVGSGR